MRPTRYSALPLAVPPLDAVRVEKRAVGKRADRSDRLEERQQHVALVLALEPEHVDQPLPVQRLLGVEEPRHAVEPHHAGRPPALGDGVEVPEEVSVAETRDHLVLEHVLRVVMDLASTLDDGGAHLRIGIEHRHDVHVDVL